MNAAFSPKGARRTSVLFVRQGPRQASRLLVLVSMYGHVHARHRDAGVSLGQYTITDKNRYDILLHGTSKPLTFSPTDLVAFRVAQIMPPRRQLPWAIKSGGSKPQVKAPPAKPDYPSDIDDDFFDGTILQSSRRGKQGTSKLIPISYICV